MAWLLSTPCTQPGCRELVKGGGRCPAHRGEWRPAQALTRGRIYDLAVWKRLRELILAGEPLCRACGEAGRVRLAEQVDHITPIERGGAPFEAANLQPLCYECHSRKTALEYGFGARGFARGRQGG